MKSGLKKTRTDHRDYDFHRTFGSFTGTLPDDFSVDAGLWVPNQNAENDLFSPSVPPLPYGCTDYTQTDLCMDEDGVLLNPMALENETHANARGGLDLRTALKAAVKVFNRTAFFNIRWSVGMDAFDAIRIAMYSTQSEKRAVSVGSPWFFQFGATSSDGILPIPSYNLKDASWHNYTVCGWKTINGVPYLIVKSWQGQDFGEHGFAYMSRELCNTMLNISGSVAFTLSKTVPPEIQTIDLSFVQTIVSFIRNLFHV